MLIFQMKRIISSEKWFNYVVTLFLFLFYFFENAKNLGRSDDVKRREKRGWPKLLCVLKKLTDKQVHVRFCKRAFSFA